MKKFVLAICCVMFCIGTCDIALRVTNYAYYRPHEKLVARYPLMPLVERYIPNSSVHMRSYGDLAAMSGLKKMRCYREIYVHVDSWGFLNPPGLPTLHKPIQLLVLGDSFAAGTGTSQSNSFVSLLADSYGMSLYNMAIPGSSPWHQMANLFLEMKRLRPHLHREAVTMLFLFLGNDLDEPYYAATSPEQLPKPSVAEQYAIRLKTIVTKDPLVSLSRRALHRHELAFNPQAEKAVVQVRMGGNTKMLFYQPYITVMSRGEQDILNHPHYGQFVATLQAMKQFCNENGVEFIVCRIPSKEDIYFNNEGNEDYIRQSTVVANICTTHNICFYDIGPILRAEATNQLSTGGELLWWPDDSHWNNAGHREIARITHSIVGQEIVPNNQVHRTRNPLRGSRFGDL